MTGGEAKCPMGEERENGERERGRAAVVREEVEEEEEKKEKRKEKKNMDFFKKSWQNYDFATAFREQ